jgi:hypothetical protein
VTPENSPHGDSAVVYEHATRHKNPTKVNEFMIIWIAKYAVLDDAKTYFSTTKPADETTSIVLRFIFQQVPL